MADTISITDISKQLNAASRLVLTTDWFWVLAADGSSVRIPAEFVRAYLVENVKPTVGEDGIWYVDGKSTGVKAEGVTPQLRGGTLGIEVSYDKGQTWKTAVLYSDMDIGLDELEKQYKKTVEGEQQRVEHENTRITNENTRQTNEQTRQSNEQKRTDAENARINAEKIRVNAENARVATEKTRATQETARTNAETARAKAEKARKEAEQKRETAFESSKSAADTATDKSNTATKNANDATALAHTATTAANNASSDAQTAERQRADAEKQRAAAEQQRAATFKELADGNAATITEMQRIASSISNAQGAVPMSSIPASICVEADFTAVTGGTANVSPTFFVPRGCNGSVMYHVVSGNATAHLNGEVTLPSDTGDVCVEVIPALNNMAGKVVTIHVTASTPLLDLSGEEITDEKGEAITA